MGRGLTRSLIAYLGGGGSRRAAAEAAGAWEPGRAAAGGQAAAALVIAAADRSYDARSFSCSSPLFCVGVRSSLFMQRRKPVFRWFKHSREMSVKSPCAISTSFSLVCPNTVDCFCAASCSESKFFGIKWFFFALRTHRLDKCSKIQSKLVIWCNLRYHHTRT